MLQTKIPTFLEECRLQLALCVPVFLAQISMMSMGVVDIVMTGRVGPIDMAAVALASSLWLPIILFGQGMLLSITPRISFYRGSAQMHRFGHTIRQGLWLALIIAIPLMTLIYILSHKLTNLGVEDHLASLTGQYLRAIMWGGPAYLFFVAIRASFDGLARMRPAMVVGFAGLLINIPCNYVLIFGKLGIEPLGGVGAGVATAITYIAMFIMLLLSALRMPDVRSALRIFEWPVWKECRILMQVGLPSALAMLCEVSMFACVSILLAPFGAIMIAGHQVALSFSGLAFMMPLSIGMAATVRIGYFHGMPSKAGVLGATRVSLLLALCAGVIMAIITFFLRHEIAMAYTEDITVMTIASTLLIFAAIYQCTDALQIVSVGILRGYNDTRAIFIITFVAYWVIAIPVGFFLGRTALWPSLEGAKGFWVAFILGVTLSAVAYLFRLRNLERHLPEDQQVPIPA